jgi:surface protein
MGNLFKNSEFNGDISNWNTGNVADMSEMFMYSKFNGDISKWDTSNVTDME